MGPRYLEWTLSVDPVHRITYQNKALDLLPHNSLVVELGCGPGIPTGKLVANNHRFVGVDISATQLAQAQSNIPSGCFVRSDMASVWFKPSSVDAVLAFYSLIHVPRDEHQNVLKAVHSWLRPGGVLALNMMGRDDPGGVDNWVDGVQMYWSGFDAETNLGLVRDAGFDLATSEVLQNFEDGKDVHFLWALGRKRV